MNVKSSTARAEADLRLRTATPADLQQAVEAVRKQLASGQLEVRYPLALPPQDAAEVNATYLFDLYAREIAAQLPARPIRSVVAQND